MGNLLHEHHNVVDLNACHGAKGTEKTEKIVKNRREDTQIHGDELVHPKGLFTPRLKIVKF